MQKAEMVLAANAMVTDAEISAAALAIAFRMGRLFGAAKRDDKVMLLEAARAGLYAAAMVRLEAGLKKNPQDVE